MKILVVFVCLVVAVAQGISVEEDLDFLDHGQEQERGVKSSKYQKSLAQQIAAKICKPFFMKCRVNAADKSGVRLCFGQFFNGCMQKIRAMMDEMDSCVTSAGTHFSQVQECITRPHIKY